jgi:hypothetical protein
MSKLLEEAIADAKAVRATALANAKAALEEAFLPKAEAMLNQKLREEAGMEEEGVFDATAAGTSTSGPNSPKLDSNDSDKNGQETTTWKEQSEEEGVMHSDEAASTEEEGAVVSDEELDEILAELGRDISEEGEAAPAPVAAAPVAPVAPMAPDMAPAPIAAAPVAPVAPMAPAPVAEESEEEEVDLNELLKSLNEGEEEEEESMEEAKEEEEEEESVSKECYESVLAERDDAVAAVNHYKKQISEVNLLNAKLLYTNKLFKNYGLTNEQKMKIVETFDLTQTVREVKIAYTSLAESFNFGKSTVKKTNTVAKTITEGLASKTVASTKPAPSVIVENTNTQAHRFQTLAGIKKA